MRQEIKIMLQELIPQLGFRYLLGGKIEESLFVICVFNYTCV